MDIYIYIYIGGPCKISCESKAVFLKGVGTELVQGVTVWMWLCNTLLFGFEGGFSFLYYVFLHVYLNHKI